MTFILNIELKFFNIFLELFLKLGLLDFLIKKDVLNCTFNIKHILTTKYQIFDYKVFIDKVKETNNKVFQL